jgi:hypothetical protein
MIDPRKKVRQVLFSVHPLSYRIIEKSPNTEVMNKRIFMEVLKQLRIIEERRDFMEEEIGMDMTQYEEQFFAVIENLFTLAYNKEQRGLIQMYLYELVPDKDWDGTVTIEQNKKERVVNFKTPEDVWNVINLFEDGKR